MFHTGVHFCHLTLPSAPLILGQAGVCVCGGAVMIREIEGRREGERVSVFVCICVFVRVCWKQEL